MDDDKVAGRPMSNSGDGDSDLCTCASSDRVADARLEPEMALTFHKNAAVMAGGPPPVDLQDFADIGEDHIAHWHKNLGGGWESGTRFNDD